MIQRARKRRDWTQAKLAGRAGLRQATISVIKSGAKPVKFEPLLAVHAALDLEFWVGARTKSHHSLFESLPTRGTLSSEVSWARRECPPVCVTRSSTT